MSEDLVDDAVAEALHHINRKSTEHLITVESEDEFLLAKMDAKLIVQVIINIVDNAIKYTPKGSHIVIRTKKCGDEAVVSIADDGYGIPDEIKPKIIDIYEQMLIEYDNYDSVAEFALQNLLEQLILIMYRYGTVAETSEIHISTADTEIMDILSYIDTNFMNNPSVSELAKKAGLSESHFMKRFRDATGCSYKTYVNRYKNKIAQTMLTESPKSIQEISNELGFCNSNYFCTLFKQINGMSPLQYRKKAVK